MILEGLRCAAVFGHEEMKIPHMCVARGEEHAALCRKTGDYQRIDVQVLEERVESRREKTGMLRLENEVIGFLGSKQPRDRAATYALLHAMIEKGAEIRSPLPEVVVDVNHRHACLARTCSQVGQPPGHR